MGNLDYLVTAAMDGTNPSGAITTDYVYDSLNRLDELTHFVDADGDGSYDVATEQAMAQFDYTLDAAGNRVGAAETVDGHEYQWSWSYDALNRLISETLATPTPGDEALAYADTFTYDLAGNRVQTTHDAGGEGGIDQSTTYAYDANGCDQRSVRSRCGFWSGSPPLPGRLQIVTRIVALLKRVRASNLA